MDHEETIQDIRRKCRLAMDGIKSTSMRTMGLDYKLNFGLVLQQIKELAYQYEQNAQLAEKLWNQGTRELIIVATHLYPTSQFSVEIANRWVATIPNQEIREQVCLNLFQELDYAGQIAIDWANNDKDEIRTTGYWLLARLLLSKKYSGELSTDYFGNIWTDIYSQETFLRNASLLALKHIGRQSKDEADMILDKIADFKDNEDRLKQEAYNSLSFEFEFIWN